MAKLIRETERMILKECYSSEFQIERESQMKGRMDCQMEIKMETRN